MSRKPQVMNCIFQRGRELCIVYRGLVKMLLRTSMCCFFLAEVDTETGLAGSSRWGSPPPPAGTHSGVKELEMLDLSDIHHVV